MIDDLSNSKPGSAGGGPGFEAEFIARQQISNSKITPPVFTFRPRTWRAASSSGPTWRR